MGLGKTEPAAELRRMAKSNFDVYVAHVQAGFSPDQAMQITISLMQASFFNEVNKPDEDK